MGFLHLLGVGKKGTDHLDLLKHRSLARSMHRACCHAHTGPKLCAAGTEPLFQGCSDIHQLCKLRAVLGSIDTAAWPCAKDLPDFDKISFEPASPVQLSSVLPGAPAEALQLVQAMLQYNPGMSPASAEHPHCSVDSLCAATQHFRHLQALLESALLTASSCRVQLSASALLT